MYGGGIKMPQVTIVYNLPDEENDYFMATNGSKFHSVLWDLVQKIREKRKYGDPLTGTWDDTWEVMWDVFKDHNFDPYNEGG
jgi:hypothetical protein